MFYIDKVKNFKERVYKLEEENKKLSQKVNDDSKKIRELQKTVDSYNSLFNNLYLYHDLTQNKLLDNSHEIILLMLDFIDNVCKKYGIEWSLCAGSVIGAVRHGGFIPWDDDCDIIMLREDYNKFLSVINGEIEKYGLENKLKVKTNKKINSTYVAFTKLDFWHERNLIGFIDIFPLDFTTNPTNMKERYKEEFERFREDLNNEMPLEENLKITFEKLDITLEKTDYLVSSIETGISNSEKSYRLFETDKMYPLSPIKFENRVYPCFKDTSYYLNVKYGEYMKIPKNVQDHSFHYRLLTTENIYEILEENIKLLREINENFQ